MIFVTVASTPVVANPYQSSGSALEYSVCLVWRKARDKDNHYESQRKIVAQAWIDSTGAPTTKENAKNKIGSF
jgi:hypothetical protein